MTIPTLSFSSWAGITAALALVGGFWRQFLAFFKRVMDLFICRVVVKDEAAKAVMSYAWKRGRRSPFGLRLFGGVQSFVSPKKRVEVVGYEGVTSEPLLFWFERIPVLIGQGQNQGPQNDGLNIGQSASTAMPVTIRYFRGTLNIDDILEEAISTYNALRQSRNESASKVKRFNVFKMHGNGGYGAERDGNLSTKTPTLAGYPSGNTEDTIQSIHHGELRLLTWKPEELVERSNDAPPFLNHPVDPAILAQFDEIDTWLKHENWFRSKGVPWRRGYLLYSHPGCGKDTLIRNLAIKHDLPIYVFDLSTYDNRSFTSDWKTVMQNAPAIALISDIDAVYDGRKNLTVEGKNRDGLTFDCLLNTLSGVNTSDGVLLFITTNHIESLDPALAQPRNGDNKSTRPGRIDKVIEIGPMGANERRKLAELILADWPECHAEIVAAGEGETAAQFQERCAQEGLRRFWGMGVKECGARIEHSEPLPPIARYMKSPQERNDYLNSL